jgi:hypothetical protein
MVYYTSNKLNICFSLFFIFYSISLSALSMDDELIANKQHHAINLSEVVSVCCNKDALTWQKASDQILKNIPASQYKVIVPDIEASHFKLISNKKFKVIPESECLPGAKDLLKHYIPSDKINRLGWYLQQLLKIAALKSANDGEIVLIWDADTIPIKPLNFIDPTGKLIFYTGVEHHEPYFKCIKSLLDIEKIVSFSFIAQCFVSNVSWVKDFCEDIETRFKLPWYEAIINCIDFHESSAGFSEYETLGTYYTYKFPNNIIFSRNPWQRLGKQLIGPVSELTDEKILTLSKKYDFITFEEWDSSELEKYNKALEEGKKLEGGVFL